MKLRTMNLIRQRQCLMKCLIYLKVKQNNMDNKKRIVPKEIKAEAELYEKLDQLKSHFGFLNFTPFLRYIWIQFLEQHKDKLPKG